VQITSQVYGTRGGYTDSAGSISGLIPQGELLSLRAYSNCGTLLAGVNLGPVLTDQDAGTIVATLLNARLIIKGTVTNCGDSALTNGYVNIRMENINYSVAVNKGAFSMTFNRCNVDPVSVDLMAVDLSTSVFNGITMTVDTGTVDVGNLTACGNDATQFIKVNVEGNDIDILSPPDNVGYSSYSQQDFFNASSSATNEIISFRLPSLTGTGTVPMDSMYISIPNAYYLQKGNLNCTITKFGAPNGGIIEGNFSGDVYNKSGTSVTATGSFKVVRF
jgi:hypothetical protein